MPGKFEILPPLTPAEHEALQEDIRRHGVLVPIIRDDEGHIIDGHHRFTIATALKKPCPTFVVAFIGTDAEKTAEAVRLNICRRHLAMNGKQRKQYAEIMLIAEPSASPESIAMFLGTSRQCVLRWKKEMCKNGQIPDTGITKMKNGGMYRRRSSFLFKSDQECKRHIHDFHRGREHHKNGIMRKLRHIPYAVSHMETLAAAEAAKHVVLSPTMDLRNCDFRELEIPEHSVDLVLTDPLWSDDAQKDWHDMAVMCSAWLKPDGVLAAFIGHRALMKFGHIVSQYIPYQTLFSERFRTRSRDGRTQIFHQFRPIVIFSPMKDMKFRAVYDTVENPDVYDDSPIESTGMEKRWHKYQQNLETTATLLRRLTYKKKDVLVVDPFLGGGTSAVASIVSGVRFVGSEIDPEHFSRAKARVVEATPICPKCSHDKYNIIDASISANPEYRCTKCENVWKMVLKS